MASEIKPKSDAERIHELREAVECLLKVLPDGQPDAEKCWDWCWNELSDDAQELVKKVRLQAQAVLD